MTDSEENQTDPPTSTSTETTGTDDTNIRKLSATAGGGLLGFAVGGPVGVLIGATISSIAASIILDDDREQ